MDIIAERRMFAKTIMDSDAFLDMPLSTQCLYFHLSMRADDDGFINNPKKIQRMIGCADDDLKLLIMKKFIIPFESGIVVIKHWKIHNYIRNDRYKPTIYQEEVQKLDIKENGTYTFKKNIPLILDTDGIPNGYQMETQVRLGKVSIGKDNNIPLKKESKIFTIDDKEYLLAKYLSKQISERLSKPLREEKDLQKWSTDFEKMVRLDKLDINEIKEVLMFSQKNKFWQNNILSASKFRKQYLTLLSQMLSDDKKGGEDSGKYGNRIQFNVPKVEREDTIESYEDLGLI